MEKRGDFKGRITSINGFSLVGLAAYAAAKDPNAFTIALVIVAFLCDIYSVLLFERRNYTDSLPVEASEYRAIAKGFVFMILLFFAGVGTAFLIAYLNDRGIIGPLHTVEVFRNCFVGYGATTMMFNIFALSLLYKENVEALINLFYVCALIGFVVVLFPDSLIVYCALAALIIWLDVIYSRYQVKI